MALRNRWKLVLPLLEVLELSNFLRNHVAVISSADPSVIGLLWPVVVFIVEDVCLF